MESSSKGSQLLLTIQAIKKDPKLFIRKAVYIYNISRRTLQYYIYDQYTRCNILLNFRKLISLKEDILLKRIFDLDDRRFSPNYANMEDMANYLFAKYNRGRVGKL